MSDKKVYTPSVSAVRRWYAQHVNELDDTPYRDAAAEFDRFLAAHDARVAREAARKALDGLERVAGKFIYGEHGTIDREAWWGWWRTRTNVIQYRDTRYPEEPTDA